MQTVSEKFKALFRSGAKREIRALINNVVYGEDKILSAVVNTAIMSEKAEVGNCISSVLTLSLYAESNEIPRMAEIKMQLRMNSGTDASEWIPKGTFYIDTREKNKSSGILTITAYDFMLQFEQPFTSPGAQGTWPMKDIDVVDEICTRNGITLDVRTRAILTSNYNVQYPGISLEDGTPTYNVDAVYTMREILSSIGGMYGGSWVISDAGELRLVVLGNIPAETNYLIEEHGDVILIGGVKIVV